VRHSQGSVPVSHLQSIKTRGDEQSVKVYQRSYQRRKRCVLQGAEQLPLSGLSTSALLFCCLQAEEVGKNIFPNVGHVM
jgi:hypothetical protein